MKVVVTGACGHIGSRLIREIPKALPNSEVWMLDNFFAQRYCSLFNLPENYRYHFVEADVAEMDLGPIFESADVVIHLAAITTAAASFDSKDLVETVNFNATKNVGEHCLRAKVPLAYVSTSSVYGTKADQVDENCRSDEIQPQSPYAETKLAEEQFIQTLGEQGLRFVICRFGTIFGVSNGMRFHTAVNKFCFQAATGQPLTIWETALNQRRPYLALEDAVQAIIHTIKESIFDASVYNVLTLNSTVSEIIEVIKEFVPDLQIQLVKSKIMNEYSYSVMCEKFKGTGFSFKGDLKKDIFETIQLLRNVRSIERNTQ